jgi:hypothetical protein
MACELGRKSASVRLNPAPSAVIGSRVGSLGAIPNATFATSVNGRLVPVIAAAITGYAIWPTTTRGATARAARAPEPAVDQAAPGQVLALQGHPRGPHARRQGPAPRRPLGSLELARPEGEVAMPTYIRPARVVVDQGGGEWVAVPVTVVAVAAAASTVLTAIVHALLLILAELGVLAVTGVWGSCTSCARTACACGGRPCRWSSSRRPSSWSACRLRIMGWPVPHRGTAWRRAAHPQMPRPARLRCPRRITSARQPGHVGVRVCS